jgi:hypothetical protein
MKNIFSKFMDFLKEMWGAMTTPSITSGKVDEQGTLLPPPNAEECRKIFRAALTEYVANGWTIEIENELDAVLSKKPHFRWVGKLIIFLLLLLLFLPLGLFYLIVVVIKGVTAKPRRMRIWIDESGKIQTA